MMAERAERELLSSADDVAGDVYIGAAECEAMSDVCRVMATVRERCPRTMFHVRSGNGPDAMEWLRQGVVDFAVLIEPVDLTGFNHLQLPVRDRQSVMVRRDHPLAALESVKPEDLAGFPIIVPSGSLVCNEFSGWLGGRMERLNVVGTSNLIQNAVMMVKAGYGCFIGLEDSLLGVGGEICFRPLSPRIDVRASLAWMEDRPLSLAGEPKDRRFSKHAQARALHRMGGRRSRDHRLHQPHADRAAEQHADDGHRGALRAERTNHRTDQRARREHRA